MNTGNVLIPVRTMMWPERFSRIAGSVALMMFTGPKKLVSNWERTRVRVWGDAASSSTVPITAELGSSSKLDVEGQPVRRCSHPH